ncbi:MAG: hypothetical protein LC633_09725, partial [Desulfobulbaceae bacterium]|nr:hypothetical protein [Desulfobulbaceae bacterium]
MQGEGFRFPVHFVVLRFVSAEYLENQGSWFSAVYCFDNNFPILTVAENRLLSLEKMVDQLIGGDGNQGEAG